MKKLNLIFTLIFIPSLMLYAGGKTGLSWKKFDEGLALAKKERKKIMLDVYADWCRWCKKLDAEVYSNDKVAEYLSKHYVSIKVNGESKEQLTYKGKKMTAAELTRGFGITGFPTIVFLDSIGEPLDKLGGFVPADKFLPIIQFIGEDHYKKMSWNEFLGKDKPTEKSKKGTKK